MTREEEIRLVAKLAAMLNLYAADMASRLSIGNDRSYRTPAVRDLLQQAREFGRHDHG